MKYKNYMNCALKEAKKAFLEDEVPVGAVIVKDGDIIACAHNTCEKDNVLYHAEIIVINDALKKLNTRYLTDCELYVTLEPCAMCTGAIIHTKIKRIYIGAMDEKEGYCGSKDNLLINTKTEVYHGICEDECKILLKEFFKQKR